MNIVINAYSARQGGGQTYIKNLLNNIPDYFNGTIYLYAPKSLQLSGDNRIHFMKSSGALQNPFLRSVWERFILPHILVKLDAGVLFCPGGIITTNPPAHCKTVTMFRNMIPFDLKQRKRYPLGYMRLRNWLLNRVMLKSMINADLLIFISQYAKQVIETAVGHELTNSVIIPHGVNEMFRANYNQTLSKPSWLPTEGYLLYVSTLEFYKAQIEVVRAYRLLKDSLSISQKLLLIGPENPQYGKLVRMEIEKLHLQQDVVIIGMVPYEELPVIYRYSTVNIFASESENCPNILLESLASGAITVSSSFPPMPEFAGNAVSYFDPGEPDDIANKIKSVLTDINLRDTMKKESIKQAKKYNWKVASKKTWDAILTLN